MFSQQKLLWSWPASFEKRNIFYCGDLDVLANPFYLNVKCCHFYHSLDYAKYMLWMYNVCNFQMSTRVWSSAPTPLRATVITLLAYWFLLPVITLFRLPNNALYSIISNTEKSLFFVVSHISLQTMISTTGSVWFSMLFDKWRPLSLL